MGAPRHSVGNEATRNLTPSCVGHRGAAGMPRRRSAVEHQQHDDAPTIMRFVWPSRHSDRDRRGTHGSNSTAGRRGRNELTVRQGQRLISAIIISRSCDPAAQLCSNM